MTWSGLRPFLSRCFVRDDLLCTRCEVLSIFFKDVIKVGFKVLICWLERNMLLASFVCWPKMFLVLHLLQSFLYIYICVNIPGCVWRFESWCVEFVYIPGCVWNFMSDWQSFKNWRWSCRRCWISSQILQKFSSFLTWFVVFVEDDDAN